MLGWLLLLFVGVPLVEFVLLFQVGKLMGLPATLGLVVGTGILGAGLARRQGFQTLDRIRRELSSGTLPAEALLDAGMILVAAAFLLTPGILTDLLGFSLLIPGCRRFYQSWLAHWMRARFVVRGFTEFPQGASPDPDEIIDAYVVGPSREADVTNLP